MPKDGQRYGKRRAGQDIGDGMVGKRPPYRWHSFDWWYGHWDERDRCGAYRPDGSPKTVCWKDRAHRGRHRFRRAPAALLARERQLNIRAKNRTAAVTRMSYRAYLEARHDQAERATRGVMRSAAGKRKNISPTKAWFSGAGPTSSPYMSEELRDWFEAHGRNLSATEYRQHT